jgi:hypothetical protein
VINIINISSTRPMSREGIGTVQMKLGQTEYTRIPFSPQTSIRVVYTKGAGNGQDYTLAWQNYFEKTMGMTCTGGPLICTKNGVGVLVVKRTEIEITRI